MRTIKRSPGTRLFNINDNITLIMSFDSCIKKTKYLIRDCTDDNNEVIKEISRDEARKILQDLKDKGAAETAPN